MVVDVAFERGDVEVADEQRRAVDRLGPAGHSREEVELLAEFGIDLAVGNVAARRDVDVLDHQPCAGAVQLDTDVARLAVVLPVVAGEFGEGHFADRGDAVIALLPVDRLVDVAEIGERLRRELVFLALDLLQAQHVGPLRLGET